MVVVVAVAVVAVAGVAVERTGLVVANTRDMLDRFLMIQLRHK